MKQIEVNGMVYEFDEKLLLKQEIRVGDNVQILIKDAYSSRPDLYSGVVTQILPFNENNPAVEVMYIKNSYSDFQIKRRIITNASDESAKIIKTDAGFLPFTKETETLLDGIENKYRYGSIEKIERISGIRNYPDPDAELKTEAQEV